MGETGNVGGVNTNRFPVRMKVRNLEIFIIVDFLCEKRFFFCESYRNIEIG